MSFLGKNRTMLILVIGFTFERKAICLYCGSSFSAAEFAATVARESGRFQRVGVCRDPIPEKVFDHESTL
jgi:hypothetical protein